MGKAQILAISGGVDSTIAFFYLKKPKTIYFDFGHKYAEIEKDSIKKLSLIIDGFKPKVIGIPLGRWENGENVYIPFRNLFIASISSIYSPNIWIAGVKGDNVEDKSSEAFNIMSKCLNKIGKKHNIKINSPFWNMTKTEIIKWFIRTHGKSYVQEILELSSSCYTPIGKKQCGLCKACLRKAISMELNELNLSFFENNVKNNPYIPYYIEHIKNYEITRQKEMKEVFNRWE